MPKTEDSLQASNDRFHAMQAERRWEISTGRYGTDHRPEATSRTPSRPTWRVTATPRTPRCLPAR